MKEYLVVYREPESAIRIYQVHEKRLLEMLVTWQASIIATRISHGAPAAELGFVLPHEVDPEKTIGVGKDGSTWPHWRVLIVCEGKVIVPEPAMVTTYRIP
jgi:hypothetical protein